MTVSFFRHLRPLAIVGALVGIPLGACTGATDSQASDFHDEFLSTAEAPLAPTCEGAGFQGQPFRFTLPESGFALPESRTSARAHATLDLTGDGRPDLVETYRTGTDVGEVRWLLYVNRGRSFAPSAASLRLPAGGAFRFTRGIDRKGTTWRRYVVTDMDGDHRADLVVTELRRDDDATFGREVGRDHWLVYRNLGSRFAGAPTIWALPRGIYRAFLPLGPRGELKETYHNVDLDADGRVDLLVRDRTQPNAWLLYRNEGTAFASESSRWTVPTSTTLPLLVDLDGDRRLDVVLANVVGQQTRWTVHFGTATGFAGTPREFPLPAGVFPHLTNLPEVKGEPKPGSGVVPYAIVDVTTDGRPDLVVTYDGVSPVGSPWRVYENLGGRGFRTTPTEWTVPGHMPVPGMAFGTRPKRYDLLDLSGAGTYEIVVTSSNALTDLGQTHWGAPPSCASGKPIEADARTWTWVDLPQTQCLDGSSTGIAVNLLPTARRVVVFLQEGGACFDFWSCQFTPHSFDASDFERWAQSDGSAGIFDRDDANNPVRDASYVFVPYCSGDVYSGNAPSSDTGYVHRGYRNVGEMLERVVPTFPRATQVVLAGSSAGGFGAAYNFDRVQRAFRNVPVDLIDDSGPAMSDAYMRSCLQARWRRLWNLDTTQPSDCVDCRNAEGGGLVRMLPFLASKYPSRRFGVISTMNDSVIRAFYGYGYSASCGFPATMPASEYEAGLLELRDEILATHDNAATFLLPGTSHTWLQQPLSTVRTSDGAYLHSWLHALVDRTEEFGNVGP